jgi:hypothetical protein
MQTSCVGTHNSAFLKTEAADSYETLVTVSKMHGVTTKTVVVRILCSTSLVPEITDILD